jgi:hypothetical protein
MTTVTFVFQMSRSMTAARNSCTPASCSRLVLAESMRGLPRPLISTACNMPSGRDNSSIRDLAVSGAQAKSSLL